MFIKDMEQVERIKRKNKLEHLYDKLKQYEETNIYPYHMPGHKRRINYHMPQELCGLDITEIDGFDNLHMPEDIYVQLQKEASQLYGAEESFYLVNGSTGGILSAISAAVPAGGHLLMARNCHKSVYHAAYLRNLKLSYLYPECNPGFDILEAITPEEVRRGLEQAPDVDAVILVSPTYEGRIADVQQIAEIVHKKGIPLIVDEAHGAHLGLDSHVHENSCRLGADLVIHSVHKTLPGLTQTALLHVNGSRINRDRLVRFLRIYQSSSPSYLLTASIDNALAYVRDCGVEAYKNFAKQYQEMLDTLSGCKHLQFLPADAEKQDIGKLVISVKNTGLTGTELYHILLEEYHLQLEMAAESYALAMFTIGDSAEGYRRMCEALLEIDSRIGEISGQNHKVTHVSCNNISSASSHMTENAMSLTKAWDSNTIEIPFEESNGRYTGEFVNLYPPGIPVLVPGEVITEEFIGKVKTWLSQGLNLQGVTWRDGKVLIKVLDEM